MRVILNIAHIGSQFLWNNLIMESNELVAYVVHRNCGIAQLDFLGQQLRLFERREATAFWHDTPPAQQFRTPSARRSTRLQFDGRIGAIAAAERLRQRNLL